MDSRFSLGDRRYVALRTGGDWEAGRREDGLWDIYHRNAARLEDPVLVLEGSAAPNPTGDLIARVCPHLVPFLKAEK